jgi:DNA-binding GntR family transcriptional regulator
MVPRHVAEKSGQVARTMSAFTLATDSGTPTSMAKLPTTSKRATNMLLDYLAEHVTIGERLPTEMAMTGLAQTSRTVVRAVLAHLVQRGLIGGMKERHLLRKPVKEDYFDDAQTHSGAEQVQKVLMERIYQRDLPPGSSFTEIELARLAGVSTITVREFLIAFSRYGLIEKKPRGGWRLCAFDRTYAEELAEARELFEFAAIKRIGKLAPDDPAFERLNDLLKRHEQLESADPASHTDFPALDREFHGFLLGLLNNRFADGLNDIVSMVFHYHYQWDKSDEMPRNLHAVKEHLAILRALARRDVPAALEAMSTHLGSARTTMLRSISHREAPTDGAKARTAFKPVGSEG